jgi:hypothetical protein
MTNSDRTLELEHDRWFRNQVRGTLERVESGEACLIPHEDFWREIETFARTLTAPGAPGT